MKLKPAACQNQSKYCGILATISYKPYNMKLKISFLPQIEAIMSFTLF